MATHQTDVAPQPRRVLTDAVVRAAQLLEIKQTVLANVLGLSKATVSRMARGDYLLDAEHKEWQLATLFVRLFRSLDAVVGSDDAASRAWLTSVNAGLGGVPLQLIEDAEGLVRTVHYLDAARGRI